ncbi:MAG: GspE/PulE family protein, partial [Planctomycetota bacterium]
IKLMMGSERIDFRLATTPTLFGEGAVIRILAGSNADLGLDKIGFEQAQLDVIHRCASAKDGFFLVTGPTGSGKTTTLYAVLAHLNKPDRKIITLEDPVENQLDGATQINANPKVGMTFSVGLRSILRQDPDVLLVGEIRDEETAEIACHAALTGHLVLSTLHTVGTAETITRLTEMNVEAYLLADTVRGIIAQRLVRRVCKNCKEEYAPEPELLERLGIPDPNATFFKGKGCEVCNGTGFKGRCGVYEIMAVDTNVASAIRKGLRSDAIQEAAQESGMITLRDDGIRKALEGQTALSEILAVTPRG